MMHACTHVVVVVVTGVGDDASLPPGVEASGSTAPVRPRRCCRGAPPDSGRHHPCTLDTTQHLARTHRYSSWTVLRVSSVRSRVFVVAVWWWWWWWVLLLAPSLRWWVGSVEGVGWAVEPARVAVAAAGGWAGRWRLRLQSVVLLELLSVCAAVLVACGVSSRLQDESDRAATNTERGSTSPESGPLNPATNRHAHAPMGDKGRRSTRQRRE